MDKREIREFKEELKALLAKYDACISFNCDDCSDTYGLYKTRIELQNPFDGSTISKLSDGWSVEHEEL